MYSITNQFLRKRGVALLAASVIATAFAFAPKAFATQDPISCSGNGVGLSVTVYRADGVTPITGGSTVQSGETIKYQATLSHLGGANCNFEGGILSIKTPDGVSHVMSNPVPLVSSGSPHISSLQSYVVSEAHVGDQNGINVPPINNIQAFASYSGGEAHTGPQHDAASAQVDRNTPFEDVSLQVSKTAVPTTQTSYTWTIDKSVVPATWNLFMGDSGTSEYTISLVKSAGVSQHAVSGNITIHNPAQFASATVTGVADSISGVGAVTVNCPGGLPQQIAPGADLVCTYSTTLPDSTTRTNTATVTTSGDVGGGEGQASIDFTNVVPSVSGNSVAVEDTFNEGDNAGPITQSTSYSYTRTFACGTDQGEYSGTGNVINNTATIVGTQVSDSASVTVNCYTIGVNKTANTTYDRTFQWNVTKVADQTEINLAEGESYDINYTVTATKTGETDDNHAVSGTITVNNPAPMAATINSVSDVISGIGSVTVDCGEVDFPATIAAGQNMICTYTSDLPNGDARTNTATAVQQNYSYSKLLVATPDGTTDKSGNANVTFGNPTTLIDEEVEVTDTYPIPGTVLGTVTVGESPKEFKYTRTVMFQGELACGDHDVDNTATLTTADLNLVDTADETVLVHVDCDNSCTLTQGYWKTHSREGKAPYDDNWASIGVNEEDTIFFQSGASWYTVFWTAPKGNAYYNLAHQYMAAVLNKNNGASVPANVQTAMDAATAFFQANTPAAFHALGKKHPLRAQVISWAGILGSYNEGAIGPGHCDENPVI